MKKLIATILILSIVKLSSALTYESTANGNWNSAIWDIGGYPDDAGDVVSDIKHNITFPSGLTLTIGNLNVSTNKVLTINGNLTVYDFVINNSFTIIVNGSFTVLNNVVMNNNSDFNINIDGNVLVQGDFTFTGNGDVALEGSMVVDGTISGTLNNVFTGGGSLTAGNIVGVNTSGISGEIIVLPIDLAYFHVIKNEADITCAWQTASEENNNYFTIERSADAINFEVIATIAGAGNSTNVLNYSYTDEFPLTGKSYYRLTQTDYDGKSETFDAISVTFFNEKMIQLSPVPATDLLTVTIDGSMGKASLKIMNMLGSVVKDINQMDNQNSIDVSTLPKGIYTISIEGGGSRYAKQVMIK